MIVPRETHIYHSNFYWIKSKIKEDFNSFIKQIMTVIKQNKNDDIFFAKLSLAYFFKLRKWSSTN